MKKDVANPEEDGILLEKQEGNTTNMCGKIYKLIRGKYKTIFNREKI